MPVYLTVWNLCSTGNLTWAPALQTFKGNAFLWRLPLKTQWNEKPLVNSNAASNLSAWGHQLACLKGKASPPGQCPAAVWGAWLLAQVTHLSTEWKKNTHVPHILVWNLVGCFLLWLVWRRMQTAVHCVSDPQKRCWSSPWFWII